MLGWNLSGNDDYVGQHAHENLMLMSRPPNSFDFPDRNGSPYSNEAWGVVLFTEGSRELGFYKFEMEALTDSNSVVEFVWSGRVIGLSRTGRKIAGTMEINGNTMALRCKNVKLSSVKIVRAHLPIDTYWNPDFVKLLENSKVLRFMEFTSTNNSRISKWTERSVRDGLTYGGYGWIERNGTWVEENGRGAPYEDCLELAKLVKAKAWINIPHLADIREFAPKLMELIENYSPVSVIIEDNNETWNTIFTQAKHNHDMAQFEYPDDSSNQWYRGWIRSAERVRMIYEAIPPELRGMIQVVLGAQLARPEILKIMIGRLVEQYGNVNWVYAAVVAPYYGGVKEFLNRENLVADDFFGPYEVRLESGKILKGNNYLMDEAGSSANSFVQETKKLTDQAGIGLCVYEGGLDIDSYEDKDNDTPGKRKSNETKRQLSNDARLYGVVKKALDTWFLTTKGLEYCSFVVCDVWTKWAWGHTNKPTNKAAPRLLAVQDYLKTFTNGSQKLILKLVNLDNNEVKDYSGPFPLSGNWTLEVVPKEPVSRIEFFVDDKAINVERIGPYRIKGDTTPFKLELGNYSLRAVPYDLNGQPQEQMTWKLEAKVNEIEELRKQLDSVKGELALVKGALSSKARELDVITEQLKKANDDCQMAIKEKTLALKDRDEARMIVTKTQDWFEAANFDKVKLILSGK